MVAKAEFTRKITDLSEDIIQLEQSLIELDEQNTMNAIEIRKCNAKIILFEKQIAEEKTSDGEPSTTSEIVDQLEQHKEIINESTKQNLIKRQQMKKRFLENYQKIKHIRKTIPNEIENPDVRDYLELLIKNNFLETQNVQLLLNLQLQARTIQDLKHMITKQQKYINENDLDRDDYDELFDDDLEMEGEESEEEEQVKRKASAPPKKPAAKPKKPNPYLQNNPFKKR